LDRSREFRIIDLTSMLSGPWATMILADQGADVIKVEEPRAGDHTPLLRQSRRTAFSASFLNLNRNKRFGRHRPEDAEGRRAREAAGRRRRRAGAELPAGRGRAARRRRGGDPLGGAPGSSMSRSTASARRGPYAKKPVYDPIFQASPGLTTVQAGADDRRPAPHPHRPAGQAHRPVTAGPGDRGALVGRLKTGKGQHVRLSMLDAVLAFLWASDMGAQTYVGETGFAARGGELHRPDLRDQERVHDRGRHDQQGMGGADAGAASAPSGSRTSASRTPALRDQNIDARLQMTQDVLKTRTTEDGWSGWRRSRLPCAPVLTRDQVIAHPQIQASGILLESDHPVAGRLRQTRTAPRFADAHRDAPRGAASGAAQRARCWPSSARPADEIAALRRQGVVGEERPE
jgi:crotonobetainyl-CoA:carnitine CoA-transferase CaiB-like acyl-CoA transferase